MYKIPEIYNSVRLVFEEGNHSYTDTLGNKYTSVTQCLHNYCPKFDKDYWLKKKAKELGISEKRLAEQWNTITKEACERGTNTHNNLEDGIKINSMFYNAVIYIKREDNSMITVADINNIDDYVKPLDLDEFIKNTENKYSKIYEVFDYYIKKDYKIYSEIGAFLPQYLLSGTIDVLLLHPEKMVIGDWKTNRGGLKFEAGYYKKDKTSKPAQETDVWVSKEEYLAPPVDNLYNCNGSIYNLQLSMYAKMVETILGIPCKGLWLCHIDSDFVLNKYGRPKRFPDGLYHIKSNPQPKCTLHKMNYLRNEIDRILLDRYKQIQADMVTVKSLF